MIDVYSSKMSVFSLSQHKDMSHFNKITWCLDLLKYMTNKPIKHNRSRPNQD